MGFVKAINLDEEAYEIWKELFGSYSQEFSKWVCVKLKEQHVKSMDDDDKKKYIKSREKEINKEKKGLKNEMDKITRKEKTEEEMKKRAELAKIQKEKEDKERAKDRAKEYKKFLKFAQNKYPKKSNIWVNIVFDKWFNSHYKQKFGWPMEAFAETQEPYSTTLADEIKYGNSK